MKVEASGAGDSTVRPEGRQVFRCADPSVAWILGGSGLPAAIDPGATALVWEDGSRTYAELRSGALALAGALRARGALPGDRVLTHLFNRGETLEIYFACAFAGLTLVPASFRATASELGGIIADVDAQVVVTEEELADTARAAIEQAGVSSQLIVLESHASGEAYDGLRAHAALDGPYEHTEPHLILFSSGTTGKPKGVQLTHNNIMSYAAQQAVMYPGYRREMTTLVVPTMFNTGGINEITIPTFLVGGTVAILPSRRWKPKRMAGFISRWEVTHACVFPTMFRPLLDADSASRLPLDSMEVIITGGEACPPEVIREARQRWPEKQIVIAYGLTEGGLISMLQPQEFDDRPQSVGRVALGQTLKIVNSVGEAARVGETGEIWTASPSVISGYWRAPELTEAALSDGWLKTGDLGYVDAEGFLYVNGRVRDMIISKGQNVFPAEIEAALTQHPAVAAVAVVGIPDPEYGELVTAVVVARAGQDPTASELVESLGDRLASYKKPRRVVFRDALPISVNNKVLKRQLVEEIRAADRVPEGR